MRTFPQVNALRENSGMRERPVGTVLQFGRTAADLAALLRDLASSIEELGEDATVLDVCIRPDGTSGDVYFLRGE
jgi:hypothetical protein